MNINAPNFGGLGLASGNTNLNLTVPGALGLQAAGIAGSQKNAMLDREQQAFLQMRQQNLLRSQMQQQAQQAQQGNYLDQQKLAQQGSQFDAGQMMDRDKLALAQAQLALAGTESDLKKQELEAQMQQKEMAKLIDMDKKELVKRGSYASYGLMAISGAKTPEESNMTRKETLKESLAEGLIDKDQFSQMSKMPLSQYKAVLGKYVMAAGMAKEYQDLNKAVNPSENKAGTQIEFNEDGTLKSLSVDPNNAVKSKVQEKVLNEEALQRRFGQIEKDFNPDYFRYGNKMDTGVSNVADMLKDTKLGGIANKAATAFTGMSPEKRDAFVTKRTTFMNDVNQVFNQYRKEITGAAAAMQELDRLQASFLSGEMAPSEFRGALDLVKSKGMQEIEQNKLVLREGVNVTPSYSREDIEAEMKRRGLK